MARMNKKNVVASMIALALSFSSAAAVAQVEIVNLDEKGKKDKIVDNGDEPEEKKDDETKVDVTKGDDGKEEPADGALDIVKGDQGDSGGSLELGTTPPTESTGDLKPPADKAAEVSADTAAKPEPKAGGASGKSGVASIFASINQAVDAYNKSDGKDGAANLKARVEALGAALVLLKKDYKKTKNKKGVAAASKAQRSLKRFRKSLKKAKPGKVKIPAKLKRRINKLP